MGQIVIDAAEGVTILILIVFSSYCMFHCSLCAMWSVVCAY
jgi:hypothetical protein